MESIGSLVPVSWTKWAPLFAEILHICIIDFLSLPFFAWSWTWETNCILSSSRFSRVLQVCSPLISHFFVSLICCFCLCWSTFCCASNVNVSLSQYSLRVSHHQFTTGNLDLRSSVSFPFNTLHDYCLTCVECASTRSQVGERRLVTV